MDNIFTEVWIEGFSVIFGLILALVFVRIWEKIENKETERQIESSPVAFNKKLEVLSKNLTLVSKEFDDVLEEMSQVADNRKLALETLEAQVNELSMREVEIKRKVNELEKISIPALEYFLQETMKSEKRSTKRDILLFFAGLICSAILSIVLRLGFGI